MYHQILCLFPIRVLDLNAHGGDRHHGSKPFHAWIKGTNPGESAALFSTIISSAKKSRWTHSRPEVMKSYQAQANGNGHSPWLWRGEMSVFQNVTCSEKAGMNLCALSLTPLMQNFEQRQRVTVSSSSFCIITAITKERCLARNPSDCSNEPNFSVILNEKPRIGTDGVAQRAD